MKDHRVEVLGSEAEDYVLSQLRAWHTLAREVASTVQQFKRIYTLLPPTSTAENLNDFESGGKVPGGWRPEQSRGVVAIENMDEALAELIQDYIAGAPGRVVVVENPLNHPEDLDGMAHLMFYQQEVHHLIAPPVAIDDVLNALRNAKSMLEIRGFMTTLPDSIDVTHSNTEITLSEDSKAG